MSDEEIMAMDSNNMKFFVSMVKYSKDKKQDEGNIRKVLQRVLYQSTGCLPYRNCYKDKLDCREVQR